MYQILDEREPWGLPPGGSRPALGVWPDAHGVTVRDI